MRVIPLFGGESQLPAVVGGLAFEHVECYPDPKLGVHIRYGTATTAKADAYLFDSGFLTYRRICGRRR